MFSLNAFSQNKNYFENGFNEGYEETLRDAGIIGKYPEYADSRKCELKSPYINEKNVKEKIYADGYRCGVQQASNAIINIKNNSTIFKKNNNTSIIEIENNINELKKLKNNLSPQEQSVIDSQISGLEQQKNNIIISLQVEKQNRNQQIEDNKNIQNQNLQQSQLALQQVKAKQENSMQSFYNETSNSLNSFSNSMQNVAMIQVYNNLKARQNIIEYLYNENKSKLDKIISIYNTISKENFNKNLNGIYRAYFISNRKYCYAPNNEITIVEDCYVNVLNNQISNIYMFGNKEMENNLPKEYPENSILRYGVAKYLDVVNLKTFDVVLIEPYLKTIDSSLTLNENNVGYITIWSSNKEDEGKTVYVQELYEKFTKLNREIVVKIQYAKNEKEIKANINAIKIPVNLKYNLFYLGEVTNTPYGKIPLATKISDPKENSLEFKNNEHRFIQVKKYRE